MRAIQGVVLGAGALVAALTVVGCGAGQPASAPVVTKAATQAVAHTTYGGSCTTADLTASLGRKTKLLVDPQGQLGAAGTHYRIDLVWTNKSNTTCTLHGFGGVDLDGPDLGVAGGPTYSLPRTGDAPTTVTLEPGASAHTTISYIDPTGSNPDVKRLWKPAHLEVTPPNQTTHLDVRWTARTPVYFDPADGLAAASISPVLSGS
ncbi:MAG TPA: DUF4232 domain-containing protein [Pseudonocardiaceae bacterium]|nr:DUF4232 domain-containing protein [Pseudonocardiaceae bacterium]